MTSAGMIDRRVTFQRATVTRDDFGGEIETWFDLASVWAHRRDASASESYRAQEIGAQLTMRLTIRYSPALVDLNPRDRMIYRDRTYNITGVRETDRNRWLEVDVVIRDDIAAVSMDSPA